MRLSGYEAIRFAEDYGLTLQKYQDPIEAARTIDTDEAREIAREDPSLLYVDTEAATILFEYRKNLGG